MVVDEDTGRLRYEGLGFHDLRRARWGEVDGLKVRHLDVPARTVAVAETVVRGRRGAVGSGQPKSAAGRRTLAVPAELMDMLVRHMAERGLGMTDPNALLFTAPGGGVLR
jgi:hypothetical protein